MKAPAIATLALVGSLLTAADVTATTAPIGHVKEVRVHGNGSFRVTIKGSSEHQYTAGRDGCAKVSSQLLDTVLHAQANKLRVVFDYQTISGGRRCINFATVRSE